MNNRTILIIFLIGILTFAQSCNSYKKNSGSINEKFEELYLFQNGTEKLIKSKSILVEKKEFSIRFFNKKYNAGKNEFYSAQIAAFLDIKELDKIRVGAKKQDLPCFEPGSGMAPDKNGKYEALIFNNSGHHYLIYENSKSKRLNLIEKGAVYQKLEFVIKSLYYHKKEVPMQETNLSKFYLAILIDRNLNGIIDDNELTKLTVKIK